jgi:2-phosphosulfolactate phosphatase
MHNNAKTILPVADIAVAYELKKNNPEYLLAGERGGGKVEGFDYGNSPTAIVHQDFTGKTLIHTTSAGTQGIRNATHAEQIITGSLVNAKAIVKYIKNQNPATVSLVCMGTIRPTAEDTLCAEYLKSLLEGNEMDISSGIEDLKSTDGKKFFDKEKQDIFPESDFYLCTESNIFDFVLKVEKYSENGYFVQKTILL